MNGHLPLETLLELSLGELEPAAAAELEKHLESCPDCAARYASLLELPDPLPGSAGEQAEEAAAQAAAWRRLRRALRLGEAPAPARRRIFPSSPAWLAAALVPLAFLLGYLARGPAATAPPVLSTAATTIVVPMDLATLGVRSRTPKRAICPPPGGYAAWVLGGLGRAAGPRAKAEIALSRPDGEAIHRQDAPDEFGDIYLILPAHDLPDGEYLIRVRGAAGPGGEEVAREYRLTLDCR